MDPLPSPASQKDQESWDTSEDLNDVDVGVDLHQAAGLDNPQDRTTDPFFPYIHGPGHVDSTPQQLSIIWQMMRAVKLTSFSPDFKKSYSSTGNKWLWEFALKCFIKLVECGEYPGVSIMSENLTVIQNLLESHVRSLMKRSVAFSFIDWVFWSYIYF